MNVFQGIQSFTEWQATGTDVDDLSAYEEPHSCEVYGAGRIYDDGNGGYIEGTAGNWGLTLGNDSRLYAELADAERVLWNWLVSECRYSG